MEDKKYYVCPVCGSCGTNSDRFPVCHFCKCENMLEFDNTYIENVRKEIATMPEEQRNDLEKGEPCDSLKHDTKDKISLREYMRRKYAFTNPNFSKTKYNARVEHIKDIHRQMDQLYQEAYDEVYGRKKVTCPTCGSTNTKKISGLSKAASVGLFGIFSQKVKHQFHCNSCGYEW
mgnify:CR=1 FL=1